MTTIAVLIMASGFSRRMGCNKLLLDLGGRVVIEEIMDQAVRTGFAPVAVVSPYKEVLRLAGGRGLLGVDNPHAAAGKSASIRLGIEALEALANKQEEPPPEGILFMTGDQILLTDSLLAAIRETFCRDPSRIVFPSYDGNPGSPALFPRDIFPRLKRLEGEQGGRIAAEEQKHRICFVPAEPGWQGADFDTGREWEHVYAKRKYFD